MAFIDKVLQQPSYGWSNQQGELIVPTTKELYKEAFSRINVFKSKKNWVSALSWLMAVCLLPFALLAFFKYFTIQLFTIGFLYGILIMSTHATIWFHRYSTHKAYTFSHPIWRFITQNLVLRTFPEEIYVVSHHVHHSKSDQPGDPYNARGGLMYCMLSDVNHQSIAKDLNEEEFAKASGFLKHTGIRINNYAKYLNWGSVACPYYTVGLWVLNWSFWYAMFFLIGGHGLACSMFTGAMFWFVLVRAFNYTGHGKGEVKHVEGVDFDRRNLSINQSRPGFFSGEWHNNHHLYPSSARAGFLPLQIDFAWMYIYSLYKLGAVSSYRDNKADFLKKYVNQRQYENAQP
ncbi:fatty acid desaturase [Spirosoma sp. BT702]|uniref:Fatty acid desaturase n=1 Tax=Spirosoma profusum TaxID=2771354 RepID=A0A926Y135_9BACT|nr:fatty acid desaturase [Spirosoma profusum]MBD2701568.1 fatty acid desaturase [Spirosoma profusum]